MAHQLNRQEHGGLLCAFSPAGVQARGAVRQSRDDQQGTETRRGSCGANGA